MSEVSQLLTDIARSALTTELTGKLSRLGSRGKTVLVSLDTPYRGLTLLPAIAVCGCDSPGRAVLLLSKDQRQWYAFAGSEATIFLQAVQSDRREPRSVLAEAGAVKILFSRTQNGQQVFYVGGDREVPTQIFSLPASKNVRSAALTNTGTGLNKWIASIAWSDAGESGYESLTHVANVKASGKVELPATRENTYLESLGYGFWASRLIAAAPPSQTNGIALNSVWSAEVTQATPPSGGCNSGATQTVLYTLDRPRVLSGSLTHYSFFVSVLDRNQFSCVITHNDSLASGSFSAKSFAFWESTLETISGSTAFDQTSHFSQVDTISSTINLETQGSVYLAPTIQRPVHSVNYSYSDLYGNRATQVAFQHLDNIETLNLWRSYLNGDKFALASLQTVDIEHRVGSEGLQGETHIFDRDIQTYALYLIDQAGVAPDLQLSESLGDLLLYARYKETFNLVGTNLYEADIYNYNNDANVPSFVNTIGSKDLNLAINEYKLTGTDAQPTIKKVKVLNLKSPTSAQVFAASYHP